MFNRCSFLYLHQHDVWHMTFDMSNIITWCSSVFHISMAYALCKAPFNKCMATKEIFC